ncbi:alpha-1,3-mannosyltransferase [Acrasis kona]|uniref:dolichyl-P-Man:Man5GlcNAc2-PP-dolichol alpha-1,3-mannosyltransferase n=1 Tax=Acrasis kona TaxID=1008807 RepID=A0AAW2YUW1_9EUKA
MNLDGIHRFCHQHYGVLAAAFVITEFLANILIIQKIPYTEIDWVAYMQEVGGYLSGDWDYTHLKGDTGPLVYPGGFVYIFSILKFATDDGKNIQKAQYFFAVIYCVMISVLFIIYRKVQLSMEQGWKKMPTLYMLVLICASRRIHSIFVLRLFNDTIAMTLLYLAILSLLIDRWSLCCVLFSFAISVKMNILLFLPGLLVLLTKRFGFVDAVGRSLIIVAVQFVLAAPFLMVNAPGYMNKAFEFGREFFHVWTVNYKFLPEHIFLSKTLSISLLLAHLGTLIFYGFTKWTREEGGPFALILSNKGAPLTARHIVSILFVSNFIGIVFARSLHYQFYVWYYHTLPFLLWSIPYLPTIVRFAIIACIEVIWNVYPSRPETSLTLTIIHLLLLVLITISPTITNKQAPTKKYHIE